MKTNHGSRCQNSGSFVIDMNMRLDLRILFFIWVIIIWLAHTGYAQVSGCTDPLALNYNPNAEVNDGSCFYASISINVVQSFTLNDNLIETSGLLYWNHRLWTQNDDTDTKLYALDTLNGNQLQSINLPNVSNTDWEEISQDEDFLYVGDFGNNAHGNRSDLHILRISKTSIVLNQPLIDTIWFSYSNQTNFNAQPGNTTEFDCEAMIVSDDSIYLFKKQWTTFKSTVYRLPKVPGTHIADSLFTIEVNGLVTGATYLPQKKLIALCGYSSAKIPFIYLLYDFPNHQFLLGNKRRININLSFHQVEGITTHNGLKYYITNEKAGNSVVTFPQQLHILDLTNFLSPYLTNTSQYVTKPEIALQIYYLHHSLHIYNPSRLQDQLRLCDESGKIIRTIELNGNTSLSIENIRLPDGIYILYSARHNYHQKVIITNAD